MAKVADQPSAAVEVRCLKDEGGMMYMEAEGITTVTFAKGDIQALAASLKTKLKAVVEKNPWLAGRMVKIEKELYIRHPKEPSDVDIDALFSSDEQFDKLGKDMPYGEFANAVRKNTKVYIDKAKKLVDKDMAFAKLSVVKLQAEGECAILFSISHAVADGHTYYKLLDMLGVKGEVYALNPERKHEEQTKVKDIAGQKEHAYQISGSFMAAFIPLMLCGKRPSVHAFYVDKEKLKIAKDKAVADGAKFVSTNDCITSGFFVASKATLLGMAVNGRNRVEGLKDDDAGNYETGLLFGKGECEEPRQIRDAISGPMPFSRSGPLPSCCAGFCGKMRYSMVSDWASLHSDDFDFENVEIIMHLPVCDPNEAPIDLCVPFKPKPGQVAVLFFAKNATSESILASCPVKETLSASMF